MLYLLNALPPQCSTSSTIIHVQISENREGADLGSGPPSLINKAINIDPETGGEIWTPHILRAHAGETMGTWVGVRPI